MSGYLNSMIIQSNFLPNPGGNKVFQTPKNLYTSNFFDGTIRKNRFRQGINELNKNKFFMAASAATIAAATVAAPISAESLHPFTDVSENYEEAVGFLYENEVIKGKTATQFGTQQTLTRGDAAVILAGFIGADLEEAPDAGFKDLNKRVKASVNALADWGIISGVTATEFRPDDALSRGAMAKLLVSMFEVAEAENETPFTDVGGVFAPYINSLYDSGITNGKTASKYGTHDAIKRGEFANLFYKTFLYSVENMYYPTIAKAEMESSTSFKIELTEALPAEYAPSELEFYYYFSIELANGDIVEFEPTARILSKDRKTVTFQHKNFDLTGESGNLIIDDLETQLVLPFNYEEPEVTSDEAVSLPEEMVLTVPVSTPE